jgi:chromosome segregation ATPase
MPEDLRVIKTGVDRLVDLITKSNGISASEAGKQLNISRDVILDWANLLEEEQIISIKYGLSRIVLKPRVLASKQISQLRKKHDLTTKKVSSKVNKLLTTIDKEDKELESFKDELHVFKKYVDDDVKAIGKELRIISKTEEDQIAVNDKIHNRKYGFKKNLNILNAKLSQEQKRYMDLLSEMNKEKSAVLKEKKEVNILKNEEADIKKNLSYLTGLVKNLDQKVKSEDLKISTTERHISMLNNLAKNVNEHLESEKKEISNLMNKGTKYNEKIIQAEKDMIGKISSMNVKDTDKKEITAYLKKMFVKKKNMKKLIEKIETDRIYLEDHLRDLVKREAVFKKTGSKSYSKHLKDLEQQLHRINQKKEEFKHEITNLHKVFKKT